MQQHSYLTNGVEVPPPLFPGPTPEQLAALGIPYHGRRIGGDIESNGLIRKQGPIAAMTKVHCIGYVDIDDRSEFYFGPPVPLDHPLWDRYPEDGPEIRALLANPTGPLEDGPRFLMGASLSVFHNGIDFDYRALEQTYPWFVRPAKAWDTLVMAKLVWPYDVLIGPDLARIKAGLMPARLMKSHSLKAWGYRLGNNKAEYEGDPDKYPVVLDAEGNDINKEERFAHRWEEWNPEMARYMMQDNRPMVDLYNMIEDRVGWKEGSKAPLKWPEFTFEYEHEYAHICAMQEYHGVRFDMPKAIDLERTLKNRKAQVERDLAKALGPKFWSRGKIVTPGAERNVKRTDLPPIRRERVGKTGKPLAPYVGPPSENYSPDAPYQQVDLIDYNPGSREHLAQRLQDVYGWKPKKFGSTGKPTVDETVLEEIPEGIVPKETKDLILAYFLTTKTLAMVAVGGQAWIHKVDPEDGRIHARMDPVGAVTRRPTHSSPNVGQVPSVQVEKVLRQDGTYIEVPLHGEEGRWGAECRDLWIADEDWEVTGFDATALELIMLGHYLVPLDNGKFRDRVCDPERDPHAEHAALILSIAHFAITRKDTKTATYLYIFGGSAYKLSLAIEVTPEEIPELLQYKGLTMLLRNLEKRFDAEFVAKLDDAQKAKIAKARKIILGFEAGIEGIKDLVTGLKGAAEKGWIKAIDGSKLHVRKAHAALNAALQSAGAICCKIWKVMFHRLMAQQGFKLGLDWKQIWDVHDELGVTHKPGMSPIILQLADLAIKIAGQVLGLRGENRTAGHLGHSWKDVH